MKQKNEIKILPCGTIEIKLTQGQVALIDKEDYDLVKDYRWCAKKCTNTFYATRRRCADLGGHESMHRLIMGFPDAHVDHINHEGCDNRRSNLRTCTHRQNAANKKHQKGGSSIYKGVSFDKSTNKYRVILRIGGKIKSLGSFSSEIKAAIIYDKSARKQYKEYAYLNFPKEGENGLFKYSDLKEIKHKEKITKLEVA